MTTFIPPGTSLQKPAARSTFAIPRILVPLDFSAPAERALRYAVMFAARLNGKITLFHVLEPGRLLDEASEIDDRTRSIQRRAEERLSIQASRSGDPKVFGKVEVRSGKAAEQITSAARELGHDLMVISTHGYTGLDRVLLGSTAERVLRNAPCPVLVVRRKDTPISEPKTILVPVDFSPASLDGLRYALGLARPFGARLTVLHVVEPPGPAARLEVDVRANLRKLREGAKLRLDEVHLEVDESAGQFDTAVRIGASHQEIVEMAQVGDFDLVVMASLGRSGLSERLLGSTAERVVRHAACPVLVVRRKASASAQTGQEPRQ